MFEQSRLSSAMVAKPPRIIYDLAEDDTAYVHPDALIADNDLFVWIQLGFRAYKQPHPNWAGRYLRVKIVAGGVLVEPSLDYEIKLVPDPLPSTFYEHDHNRYAPVQFGVIAERPD